MKARTNVSIDQNLLEAARSHNLILSSILEDAIKKELSVLQQEEWESSNKESIASYNKHIADKGVFSDEMRTF